MVPVPGGSPFAVAATDGWSFVSMVGSPRTSLAVFRDSGASPPKPVHRLPGGGLGVTLTPHGRYLLVANGSGITVVSVALAERGSSRAVLGMLSGTRGGGAIEVAVTPDGRFAFVSIEYGARIDVFNLQRALASGFRTSGYVGAIRTGLAPVGMAVSPDGRWLYATSEVGGPGAIRQVIAGRRLPQGTLMIVNVRQAESDPAHATVASLPAGCQPVRVITSADGKVVWVTARASDEVLGYSAAALTSDPAHVLIARAAVGSAPVGIALVDGGRMMVVADSDRFNIPHQTANLAVVNVADALAGRPALVGYLPAGGFPRDMALSPGGRTLLVADFTSGQLESVDVANLP